MFTALAAAAPWVHGPSFGFPFFFLAPLFWLIVLVVLFVVLARARRRRWAAYGGPSFGPHRSPEATLSERYANGEIDEVEYRQRLEVLRANRLTKR